MQAVLDEIIEKTTRISDEERDKLIAVLQEQKNKNQKNGGKGFVHPNTLWIKENHADYQGKYVAVENGKLVGTGKTFPEALADSKKNGSEKPMITYLPREDEELWGGW